MCVSFIQKKCVFLCFLRIKKIKHKSSLFISTSKPIQQVYKPKVKSKVRSFKNYQQRIKGILLKKQN